MPCNSITGPENLQQLIDLWKKRVPRRANAGEYALHGFRFQLMVALRDAVRAFLNGQDTEPTVIIEQISDICQKFSDDTIVFTQVKTIGRTVNKALEELWEIHALASEEAPLLASQLRYQILCAEWTLKNIQGAINRWEPVEYTNPVHIQSFKERVSYTTDPNPFDDVLALVTQLDADEPFKKVLFWIGLLTDPARGYSQLWSELVTLQKRQRTSGTVGLHLWSPEDRPPKVIERGSVLPGYRPRPIHLREGYFCDRPVYRELAEEVIQWISSNPWESDISLHTPVLWIGGRSGCGKSVAMLHVLARLHEDGIGPIIWLGNDIKLLPEAVRRARGIAGPSDQVIIALDDPYAPRTQGDAEMWQKALSELHFWQDRNTERRLPIILCCGPTSQARQLEEDFTNELYRKMITVPHTLDDRQALETWYERRTGKQPPTVGHGDVLLVQLFFEWREGRSLASFAHSFKKRLREEDPSLEMLNMVYRIVCANRFYVGGQPSVLNKLNPVQRDAFELLLAEHHFAVDEDPERSGVWLTHPHIAHGLFEAWFPRDTKLHQKQDIIKKTIFDGLQSGVTLRDQTALLWALARLSRADEHLRERLVCDEPEVFLPEVYAAYRPENGAMLDLKYIPAWLELRFSYPSLCLTPDPVVEGCAQLLPENKEEIGFRLTCHKLIEYLDKLPDKEQPDVQRCIENMLVHTQGWIEWPTIAIEAICKTSSQKIRDLFENWILEDNKESPLALSWFNLRQNVGSNSDWLLNINLKWIKQHGDAPDAGHVISSLLKRPDLASAKISAATMAYDWIQKHLLQPQVERVIRRLLGIPLSDETTKKFFRLTLDYIEHTGLQSSSSFLLSAILRSRVIIKAGALKTRAIRLGQMWFKRYSDDPGFFYVADRLLRLPQVSDADWSKIASQSLDRLDKMMWPRDADYTLVSILRRKHLLSKEDNDLLYDLLCGWLKHTEQEIIKFLYRPRPVFNIVSRKLARVFPLVAHTKDIDWQTAFEAKAIYFRESADKESREKFDRELRRLFKARCWPSHQIGRGVLYRLGLIPDMGKIIAKLNNLLLNKTKGIDSSLQDALDEAYLATEAAIAEDNFKGAGYLLAKMLPLSARLSVGFLDEVVSLVRNFIDSSPPIEVRCGLILECDKWIEQSAWPDVKVAFLNLQRAGLDTPRTLEFLARTQSATIKESVSRTLDLLEALFQVLPLRIGLFLPPLMVITQMSGESASIERCQQLVHRFLESPNVHEVIKSSSLPVRLKKLIETTMPSIPNDLQVAIESLGLQAPWLMENTETSGIMNAEDLKRHLLIAKQLIQQNSPTRASFLLAPLLLLSANSREDDMLEKVCEVTMDMLEHPLCTHESRDGFFKVCWRFKWPDDDIQDDIFQFLGIGAPKLSRLLSEREPTVTVDVLQRSLEYARKHLRSVRPRGAYQILLNALPLASWTGDNNILERTLEHAREFMAQSMNDKHIIELFSNGCILRLQNGRWRNSDLGLKCLADIGIREAGHRAEGG